MYNFLKHFYDAHWNYEPFDRLIFRKAFFSFLKIEPFRCYEIDRSFEWIQISRFLAKSKLKATITLPIVGSNPIYVWQSPAGNLNWISFQCLVGFKYCKNSRKIFNFNLQKITYITISRLWKRLEDRSKDLKWLPVYIWLYFFINISHRRDN